MSRKEFQKIDTKYVDDYGKSEGLVSYELVDMEARIVSMKERYFVGVSTNFICILSEEKNNDVLIPKLWNDFLPLCKDI